MRRIVFVVFALMLASCAPRVVTNAPSASLDASVQKLLNLGLRFMP